MPSICGKSETFVAITMTRPALCDRQQLNRNPGPRCPATCMLTFVQWMRPSQFRTGCSSTSSRSAWQDLACRTFARGTHELTAGTGDWGETTSASLLVIWRATPEGIIREMRGRIRVRVPRWWAEAFIDSRANGRGNIYAGGINVGEQPKSTLDAAGLPPRATLDTQDGKLVVRVGMESAVLPDDFLDKVRLRGANDLFSTLITPTRCYIAVHDDFGSQYQVACIDNASKTILWIGGSLTDAR